MGDLVPLLIGSNSAVVLVLVYLVHEVTSMKRRVTQLSDDVAFLRGVNHGRKEKAA